VLVNATWTRGLLTHSVLLRRLCCLSGIFTGIVTGLALALQSLLLLGRQAKGRQGREDKEKKGKEGKARSGKPRLRKPRRPEKRRKSAAATLGANRPSQTGKMHDYDSGMVGDMAGILLPAPANAPSPFTFYLTEDEILQAGILQAGNAQSEEPDATMEAVLSLFSLDENNPHASDDDDEENGELDLVDQQLRTQRLRSITLSLDQLWWSGPRYMAAAAEKLADGSRDRK